MKPIRFMGDSLRRLRLFPKPARQRAGYELESVQHGDEPSDWKPMSSVGAGVCEIRVHVEGEYRVLYVTRFANNICVLHVFRKKTRKTPKADIELARVRYREAQRLEESNK